MDGCNGAHLARDLVRQRISELDAEHRAGERMLAELDAKRADVERTLLRIDGAIQVLNELLVVPTTGDDQE